MEDIPGVLKTNRGSIVLTTFSSLLVRLFFAWGSKTPPLAPGPSRFLSNGVRKGFLIIVDTFNHELQLFPMCETMTKS